MKYGLKGLAAGLGIFSAVLLAAYFFLPKLDGHDAQPAGISCSEARKARKNYAELATLCRRDAKRGDIDALIIVAEFEHQHILYGHAERDDAARTLFEEAAEHLEEKAGRGEVGAQYMLGYLYAFSMLQNGQLAGKWFCSAAKQGSTQAAAMMGELAQGHLHQTLHSGADAYDNDEALKWDCAPGPGVPSVESIDIGPAAGLCPHKTDIDQSTCFW